MDVVEIVGVAFGLWSVWLTVKERILSWPVGIVNIGAFIILFYQVRLYADMGLQFFFLVLSIYGWWVWVHPERGKAKVLVTLMSVPSRVGTVAASAMGVLALGTFLSHYTNAAVPYWDSTATMMSIMAQYLMARKKLECWVLWIAVDVLSVGIYLYKDLLLTAGLYVIFLVLASAGLLRWRKSWRSGTTV